ncbi:MAG TPA: hypothetical protein DEQ61_13990, partial [Streptomyces sp.]|nr:hypothetical protein [Streptomyces sp.]
EAAQFWWQFAAGGGSRTAAYCLYLHHRRLAEFRDADFWRAHAARLVGAPCRPRRRPEVMPALLPDAVREDLLSQCHDGRHPRLPAALEAVINRLRVIGEDEDFGEVPQPHRGLAADLATGPTTPEGADGPDAGAANTR